MYTQNTRAAPTKAPATWAAQYGTTFRQGNLRRAAKASVTAGLRCAPLTPPATHTANATAKHHPNTIGGQSPAARKIVVGVAARPEPGRAATAIAASRHRKPE